MKPTIIFQKMKPGLVSRAKQRAVARALVLKATGKNLRHFQTGRPMVDESVDVSISHKEDLVCVGLVPKPYRIGVDVERVDNSLNAEIFFGPVITRAEQAWFRTFCEDNNFSLTSGVAIFWSIKEAFFKCLDYDLKPGKVSILAIASNGRVKIDRVDEIRQLMAARRLKLCSVRTFFDQKHSYAQAIMKESQPQ